MAMKPVDRLLATARAEIGYIEKETNAHLDDKTANAGDGNWNKYARDLDALGVVYNSKKNGYAWCDIFTDWCFIQTFGLEQTTSGKNAFFTAVYCVIVPFLYWFIAKRRPDRFNLIAAFLCIGGIALVSITGDNASAFNMGDVLTLIGGFFFAAHIVAVSRYSEGRDIFILTTLQFASFALFSWLGVLITRPALTPGVFDSSLIMGLAYLVICASCGALLFQNIGQKYTAPSTAAVLLSLEAPFGVFFSILFANERPTPLMFVGFALIFIAVVCSETKFSFLRKKKS